MKKTAVVLIAMLLAILGCGEKAPQWPEGSGYLTPAKHRPSEPLKVDSTSRTITIIGANGPWLEMDGDEIMDGDDAGTAEMLHQYPGATVIHAYAEKESVSLTDYNGDKCIVLYGMTVKVDKYGQYAFVKYEPNAK